jgi:hypothetical protein
VSCARSTATCTPGALHDDWEPARAVSWDLAMTVTPPDWRVALRPGDEISISATYDTRRASWYESMGIMFTWYSGDPSVAGTDPFAAPVQTRGPITHGHLPENDNHGGGPVGLPDARRLLAGTRTKTVTIKDFVYGRGDLSLSGRAGRPPVIRSGQSLRFKNLDSRRRPIYHTITACKEPCNRRTGIAYPLADGRADFDSASWASARGSRPRRPTATPGRRRRTSRRAPTRSSAGCTRSCAGRSV